MTYIVKDECIKCKLTDCVEVCPVDCFYEGENMLVINPDECIDCGVCEPECPIDAIKADSDETVLDKEIDTYIFTGEKKKKKKIIRFDKKENPFNKLLSLNIK